LEDKMNEETSELFSAEDIQFYYLFYDKGIGSASWITSFSVKNGPPEAVKLDIRRKDKEFSELVFIPK